MAMFHQLDLTAYHRLGMMKCFEWPQWLQILISYRMASLVSSRSGCGGKNP
jgi:hypothetical protein